MKLALNKYYHTINTTIIKYKENNKSDVPALLFLLIIL
jgi:hypothetical protein